MLSPAGGWPGASARVLPLHLTPAERNRVNAPHVGDSGSVSLRGAEGGLHLPLFMEEWPPLPEPFRGGSRPLLLAPSSATFRQGLCAKCSSLGQRTCLCLTSGCQGPPSRSTRGGMRRALGSPCPTAGEEGPPRMRCPGPKGSCAEGGLAEGGKGQTRLPGSRGARPEPSELSVVRGGGEEGLEKPSRSHDTSASHCEDLGAHGVCKRPARERTSDATSQ